MMNQHRRYSEHSPMMLLAAILCIACCRVLPARASDPCGMKEAAAAIRSRDPGKIQGGVKTISNMPAECIKKMLDRLDSYRAGPKTYDAMRLVMGLAKIPLPPYSGWFKVPTLKVGEAPPYRKVDTLAALEKMKPLNNEPYINAHARLMEMAAVVRALGSQRDSKVLEPLIRFTFRIPGIVLRAEVNRSIERLGGYAIPGLYKLGRMEVKDWKADRERYLVNKFAGYVLTLLEEGDPSVAMSRADVDLKLLLLETYGRYHPAEAVRAVIIYTDHEDTTLRKAARKALEKYFQGPAPRVHLRRWKLPGGSESQERRLVYVNFRQRAAHEVRLELERLTAGKYERGVPGKQMVKELYEQQDRRRMERNVNLFNKATSLYDKGSRDEAITLMKRIMTEFPQADVVPGISRYFMQEAIRLTRAGELDQAIDRLLLSAVLHDSTSSQLATLAEADYVRALLHEATGRKRKALVLHRRTLALKAKHTGSHRAVLWLEGQVLPLPHALLLAGAGCLVLSAVLWLLIWGLMRRKRAKNKN